MSYARAPSTLFLAHRVFLVGFPKDVIFKEPSPYGKKTLERLLSLVIDGSLYFVSMTPEEHTGLLRRYRLGDTNRSLLVGKQVLADGGDGGPGKRGRQEMEDTDIARSGGGRTVVVPETGSGDVDRAPFLREISGTARNPSTPPAKCHHGGQGPTPVIMTATIPTVPNVGVAPSVTTPLSLPTTHPTDNLAHTPMVSAPSTPPINPAQHLPVTLPVPDQVTPSVPSSLTAQPPLAQTPLILAPSTPPINPVQQVPVTLPVPNQATLSVPSQPMPRPFIPIHPSLPSLLR
jgi:hypothetical protein